MAQTTPTVATTAATSPRPTPASLTEATIRRHLEDINSGHYQQAFELLSASYRDQNPTWASVRAEADSGINIISVGNAVRDGADYEVSVVFYARDRSSTKGSDTQCREFRGTVDIVDEDGHWRYSPSNGLTATIEPRSNPHCPN